MTLETVGRYKIISELGRGGMSTVYSAHDPISNRDVAIKILPPELLHDPMFRARFEREAQIIAALEHPAILPIYDYGEADGQPFFVMRLMTGGSLADRLRHGPLPLAEAARIISKLAGALDEAHQRGIIHRDLKPGNILFDQNQNPVLADFGIAKLSEAGATLTGNVIVGTPAYMSPEQGRGEKDLDGRSDVYSLGVILFEMLTGHVPFQADTPMGQIIKHMNSPIPVVFTYQPGLPRDIQEVINRAMHKRKFGRFSSAGEMAQALQAVVAGKPLPVFQAAQTFATLPGVEPLPSSKDVPAAEAGALGAKGEGAKKEIHWAWRLLRTIGLALLSLVLLAALVGVGLPIVVFHEYPDSFYTRMIYDVPVVPHAIRKTATPKPTFTPLPSATRTVLPTIKPSATPKLTGLLQPTPTQTSLPTATPVSIYPIKDSRGNVAPQETLSASNVDRLQKIAVSGNGAFLDIAISQDATTLAVATTLGVDLYDIETFKHLGWLPSQNPVHHLEFSPDGRLLALAELEFAALWYWQEQNLWKKIPAHPSDKVAFVSFSTGGEYIWGGAESTTVWKIDDSRQTLWVDGVPARSVSISMDDALLAAPTSNTIQLIQLSDGSVKQELRAFGVYQAKFLPNGDTLLAYSDDLVHVFSLSQGVLVGSIGGAVPVLSQDGTSLATDNGAGKIQVWRLTAEGVPGFPIRQFDQIGYSSPETWQPNYQISQNGEYLAYWNTWYPNYIFQDLLEENRSWSSSVDVGGEGEPFDYSYYNIEGNERLIKLIFSPLDTEVVVSLWQNRLIEAWDFTTEQAHKSISYAGNSSSSPLAIIKNQFQVPAGNQQLRSPDQAVVARAQEGTVLISASSDSAVIRTIYANLAANTDLAFSPDSQMLATISLGPTIRLWNVADGRQVCVINGDGASPEVADAEKLYFSEDNRTLAVLLKGLALSYWEAQTCRKLVSYYVQNTSISQDGTFFVEPQPSQLNLRKLNDGSLIRTLYGEFERYTWNLNLGFSADGRYLSAEFADGTTHLWGIIP